MKKHLLTASIAFAALSTLLLTGCEKEDKDAISMSDVKKDTKIILGKDSITEYEVVDLGLPSGVLWATCNIGASSPEQTGQFFAWGETESKEQFSDANYKWCNGNLYRMTKYTFGEEGNDVIDNQQDLDISDDAANFIMGTDWHIPEVKQFRELFNTRYCKSKWCKLNGVGGFLFTSVRKNYEGRAIFLPLSGMKDMSTIRFSGQYGFYWSNSLYKDNLSDKISSIESSVLWLEHKEFDNHVIDAQTRYLGLPIRPVYIPKQ